MTGSSNDTRDHALQQRIVARTQHCLQHCAALCRNRRVALPRPEVRFDLRGSTAGQCVWVRGSAPLLRFNLSMAARQPDRFVTTTVAHEVAHLVTTACHGHVRPHGKEWRAVMRHLGIAAPQRCHDYALDERELRKQRRWPYHCDCGTHHISTTRHNRVERATASYLCRRCGSALRAGEHPHRTSARTVSADSQSADDQ